MQLAIALGVAMASTVMWTGTSGAATTTAPYTDPDAVGYIGLCNQAGQQVTSGSTTTVPFVWRAVSSEPAPAGYNGPSRTATLTAYLPVQVLAPGEWSGEELTAASRYTNPEGPMAAATDRDVALQTFIGDYPPQWDGFIQLRLFLGAADEEPATVQYPALNIQVTGDIWKAIGGGTVNCASGTSESMESILLPGTTPGNGTGSESSSTSGTGRGGSAATQKGTGSAGGSTRGGGAGARPGASSAVDTSSTAGHVPLFVGIGFAALAAVVVLGLLSSRRRRGSDPATPDSTSGS